MMTSVWVARLFVQPWLTDGWSVGRSKCASVWAVGLLKLEIANCCETFYCNGKYWCGLEKQIGPPPILLLLFFSFIVTVRKLRQAQDKMFWRNLIHYGYTWSQRRRCTPSLSEIKIDFFVFSVLSDCSHTLTTISIVGWITEKETGQTQDSSVYVQALKDDSNSIQFIYTDYTDSTVHIIEVKVNTEVMQCFTISKLVFLMTVFHTLI